MQSQNHWNQKNLRIRIIKDLFLDLDSATKALTITSISIAALTIPLFILHSFVIIKSSIKTKHQQALQWLAGIFPVIEKFLSKTQKIFFNL